VSRKKEDTTQKTIATTGHSSVPVDFECCAGGDDDDGEGKEDGTWRDPTTQSRMAFSGGDRPTSRRRRGRVALKRSKAAVDSVSKDLPIKKIGKKKCIQVVQRAKPSRPGTG
jgi:hypothetical protein